MAAATPLKLVAGEYSQFQSGDFVSLTFGGTGANLTASNGGIVYSTASAMAILAGTATANKLLVSGASGAPSWSTPTFPNASATSGKIIISDGTNWIASTNVFPNTISSGSILYATSANTIGENNNRYYINSNGLNVNNVAGGSAPTMTSVVPTTTATNIYGAYYGEVSDNAVGTLKILARLDTRTAATAPNAGHGGYIQFNLFKRANTGYFESGRVGTNWTNTSDNGRIFFATGASGTVADVMSLTSTGMYVGTQTVTTVSSKVLDVNGDVGLVTAGNGFYIKEGTNATMGTATLVGGTIVVSTTKVTANSRIFLTVNGGTLTNVGTVYVSARSAGASFTIMSVNILDTSNVAWIIVEPG